MAAPLALLTRGFIAVSLLLSAAAHGDFDAAGYYRMRCSTCHGAEGEGTDQKGQALGPALKGNPLVMHGPPAALANVIRKGRSGAGRIYDKGYPNMPSFGPEAVPDVDALIAYLKETLQASSAEQQAEQQPAPAQQSSPQSAQPATRQPEPEPEPPDPK